ncbi:response regulator [Bordetella parapertussis]|uniref:Response regulator protein n=8 Tax=Bordetella TaxID=517 RepID=A0A0T7CUF1_BORP1|nr:MULTISPECIES: response regulator [Bordetella]KAK63565.1 response regulator receiver domain protein [Bordetella bronchiseptica 980-2]KCV29646.1 response regulator receiver domain protein [Bordetella bronchiseptica 00-P-2730]KDD49102.1 response regulator receiver domain protein [Bordetella bronchiseptica OSU553]SHP80996.1 PhoP family transcriptional regulator [Mycobacteroides abscessus subsp. abscessus]AMG86617.1 DNA-binding response regulator [Bordetella bronchiseptica]
MRILLIEDEAELARWLSRSLARHAGFVVEWADDGLLAERRLAVEEFDAIILDLGLPGMDGHTLLTRIRARDDRTPVLVLTARDSLAERVGTLHQGADDFLPKPFVLEELEARLTALIRRSRGREHPRLTLGDLALDTASQRFTVKGQPLALSPREHAVLRALIQRSGEPLNKQQILDRIQSSDSDVNLEAIEVLVHRLRKKLADTGVQIVTMRGMGYCLENAVDNP